MADLVLVADGARQVRRVTRAICWLPPGPPHYSRDEQSSGTWSRVEETWQLLGRVGCQVTVETYQIPPPL
jgi:hypothetical protein